MSFLQCCFLLTVLCSTTGTLNSVAWYYQYSVPVLQLSQFDVVVVSPSSNLNPATVTGTTKYFAYASLGEVNSKEPYYKDVPKSWIVASNDVWGTYVINVSVPAYADFFATKVVGPQWTRGYRGFFFDTMDSYERYATTSADQAKQQAGIVNIIKAVKAHYPNASLIFNRGFEIMPQVHDVVFAVAFESLYASWDNAAKKYVAVDPDNRSQLLAKVKEIKELDPNIPFISIEYCSPTPANNTCQQNAIENVKAQGVIPYVADGLLMTIGRST
uniref:Glycoside-hydrolase family GH114 TIM-barrel domain-containing protein n=1 Tax=Plectus sambesii TaxID=2011161 RepID=A0A914VJX8_9BILA